METDVVVVGAGPVGLMLAAELRLGGARVAVVERLAAPITESRALGFNRRTAETLDQRGLLAELGEVRWGAVGHLGGVRFDLSMLDEDHSGVLGLPQPRTEAALANRVARSGGRLLRGTRTVGVEQSADAVQVAVEGPDGPDTITAAYVVGCDGALSSVRRLAGIATREWPATRGSYSAEVRGVELRPRPTGERLPGGDMVLCTPIGRDAYRIVIHDHTLPPDVPTPPFVEVADAWHRLTGERINHGTAQWLWACGNGAALAETYRTGRVLLAGDAAHPVPPLAAWGLSAGIQDSANLGWKLAATVAGWAPADLLDTYDAERRPVGATLVRNVQAATTLYLGRDVEPVRSLLHDLLADPATCATVAGHVSGLGIRYDLGHPLAGTRLAPNRVVVHADGSRTRVADLLHPGRGVLILGADTRTEEFDGWASRVDVVYARLDGKSPQSMLVRPDGYLAWTSEDTDRSSTELLSRWFGAPTRVSTGAIR